MNAGLYISASAAIANMYRQDVLAGNLANVDTVGYRPDFPLLRQRDTARIEDGLGALPSNALLERLGAGVMAMPSTISFSQGDLKATGNPLDVAIEGDGFLLVGDTSEDGRPEIRLTRDGRLTLDESGRLVLAASGHPVLSVGGAPIMLDPARDVAILPDGVIAQDGRPVAQLDLADVHPRVSLRKIGGGLLAAPPQVIERRQPAIGRLHAGYVEGSGVNEIAAMMQITGASNAVSGNAAMIQHHDRLMDGAINRLGRIA